MSKVKVEYAGFIRLLKPSGLVRYIAA